MSAVAVLRTSPESVITDYKRLMDLSGFKSTLVKNARMVLKLNLSWTLYYPACSTAPWQLEGAVSSLLDAGYRNLVAVENQTVVTHPWRGAYNNKWLSVLEKYGVSFQPLTDVEWVSFRPRSEMLVMDRLFSEILIPRMFQGSNVVHLPTMKTHGHTTTTGAMKNAFGGLIPKYRHHAHLRIHEVLVDLLAVQKEIHKGIFAVMDGCIAGNGAGPRTMEPFSGDLILAGEDQVALDAVAARVMGFDPMKIDYIRIAHDRGLGMGDLDQVEIAGISKDDFQSLRFGFRSEKSPVIRWDQRIRKGTHSISWLHNLLFHSPVFTAFILGSELYHDRIWYPLVGMKRMKQFKDNGWSRLFQSYPSGNPPSYSEVKDWNPY